MKYMLLIGMIFSSVMSLSGCGSDANAESPIEEPDRGVVIHESQFIEYGSYSSKGSKVLLSQNDYEKELVKYSSESPVNLDFSISKVLLLDMGKRNTGGYTININEVARLNDHVIVYLNLIKPDSSCVTTSSLSNPYQFVKIDTTETNVLIKESLVTKKCD